MTRSFSTRVPKLLMQPVNNQGGGQYRAMLPASLMRRQGYAVTQAHPYGIKPEALFVLDPDVVVFQMFQTEKQQERIKQYRQAVPRAFFVYEIDDLFWEVPKGSVHAKNPLLPTSKSNIRTAAKLCNAITVTTPALAAEMRKLTGVKDIRVVPNEVPRSFINAALAGRRSSQAIKSDKPRIGWAGGIGHTGDLKLVSELYRRMGDEVQWVFMGMAPFGVNPGPNVEVHPGVSFADYPRRLGELNLDIALAPLEDNAFNRCKSDLRVLEYAAAGFPTMASDIGTYENTPAIRLPNDPNIWEAEIRRNLRDRERLEALADLQHEWVISHRCMDDHVAERVRSYLPRGAEPFVPGSHNQNVGQVVSVGAAIDGIRNFESIGDAWHACPGADVLYVRPGTHFNSSQAARLISCLDKNASATPLSNDGVYPVYGKFVPMTPDKARKIDFAAAIAGHDSILCPFPTGPVTLLSGVALARNGLPDEERFGSTEYALADWGARCLEHGAKHTTVPTVYAYTENQMAAQRQDAQLTLEHINMWQPAFGAMLQAYQQGDALAAAREDVELAFAGVSHDAPRVDSYADWYGLYETVSGDDRVAIQKDIQTWEAQPKISVVTPTYNTPIQELHAAIRSVLAQTYDNWELVIVDDCSANVEVRQTVLMYTQQDSRIRWACREKNGHICAASNDGINCATGDWVVFLDHDDELAPTALYMLAREIVQNPAAQFIYSDSDKISPEGELIDPYFAPDFSYELLLAQNYVTHMAAYRLANVKEIGGLMEGTEGSQDWDLVLRYLEKFCGTPPDTKLIRHIPHVLYHWRQSENSVSKNITAKPYAWEAGRKAVMGHLSRTKQAAFVGPNPALPIFNMVRFLVPENAPKVTVIIPTKDNHQQLDRCLGGLFGQTLYSNFDVIVLDDHSIHRDTREFLTKIGKMPRVRVVRMTGEFNFADFNNRAVEMTDAEFVCLMNDDVEVIERSWLNDLVGLALRPGVGAVGPKLLYPNDTVQQAGIIFSPKQPPGQSSLHLWQQLPMNNPGQAGRAQITQPVLAVGGACMLVRRSLYQEMGGLDAIRFPVDWNDVDFCIRLHKAGYRNIVAAQASMHHHEAQTKKRLNTWRRERMLADEQKLLSLHSDVVDPYINPNLVFHPHQVQISRVPTDKPWRDDVRPRVLVVNGDQELYRQVFRDGGLAFGATIEGHYLVLSEPPMPNVRPIDLRTATDEFETTIQKLGVTDHIIFCGIGDGTLASVGFMTAVAGHGWHVVHKPTKEANTGNDHEYYDPAGWRATWQRFLDAISQPLDSIEGAEAVNQADDV